MKNITLINRLALGFAFTAAAVSVVAAPALAFAATFTRELSLGMSGGDVSSLQTFLGRDASIYPQDLVTGYFGNFTKAAVINFQSRNNIPTVGRVGPMTLLALNAQIDGTTTSVGGAATIYNKSISTNRNSANVIWNTNTPTTGVVYYSTTPLVTYEHLTSVDVSGSVAATDFNLKTSQNVLISNLQANTVYYYMLYSTDQSGNVTVTVPGMFQTSN